MKKAVFLISFLASQLWANPVAGQPQIEIPQPNAAFLWGDFIETDPLWRSAANLTDKFDTDRELFVALDVEGRPVVVYSSDPDDPNIQFPNNWENLVDIAVTGSFSLVVTQAGDLLYLGRQDNPVASIPENLSDVVDIEAGHDYAVALTSAGQVVCWGLITLESPLENIVFIDAGDGHAAAISNTGEVIMWGNNDRGQTNVPANLENVIQVVCKAQFTLALKADGTIVSWGQLFTPVPSGTTGVARLVSDTFTTWAVLSDGSMTGWGDSDEGELDIPVDYEDIQLLAIDTGINFGLTQKPVIAPQPSSSVRSDGGNDLTLAINAVGPGPLSYQWFQNGQEITGATESYLFITRVVEPDSGIYQCRVLNSYGTVFSHEISVEVRNGELVVFKEPQPQTIGLNEPFELSFEVGGIPPLTYQWYKDNQPIPGAVEAAYSVDSAKLDDIGNYRAVAENGEGRTTESRTIDVLVVSPPILEPIPESLEILAGMDFEMTVPYESPVPVTFQWYKDGLRITEQIFQTLSISNIQSDSSGIYHVVVANEYGETISSSITLSVMPSAPQIISDLEPQFVALGSRFTQTVKAAGTEPLSYIWWKDGETISGEDTSRLVIPEFTEADTGTYQVEIGNSEGTIMSSLAGIQSYTLSGGGVDFPNLEIEFLPFNFSSELITVIENAGDGSGRLFAGTQRGSIWVVQGDEVLETPLLSVPAFRRDESGLQSVAFPPDFESSGRFYVSYSTTDRLRISRFAVSQENSNIADIDSEAIILEVPQQNLLHYGGQIKFGPDGMLYVSVGDDAEGIRAQDLSEYYGKILRIDPENAESGYLIPNDNPFASVEGALPEIWIMGLRNPWRFSFDPFTGDAFIGDVGEQTWEELNLVPASEWGGQNFGWNLFEGRDLFGASESVDTSAFTFPIFSYQRDPAPNPFSISLASIIGGYVYNGTENDRMYGMYFFGDFGNSSIYAAARADQGWQVNRQHFRTQDFSSTLTTFGVDESGELYVSASQGRIARIVDSGRVSQPTLLESGGELPPQLNRPLFVELLSSTTGAEIYYTLDGSEPTTDSILYEEPFWIDRSVELMARAFRLDLEPSFISDWNFNLFVALETSHEPQLVEEAFEFFVSASFDDAEIRFTLDGSDPVAESSLFENPMIVQPNSTIKLVAFLDGLPSSAIWEGFFPQRIGEPVVVERIAGTGQHGMLNGSVYEAQFENPTGLLVSEDGGILVADTRNHLIRKIGIDGAVTTIAEVSSPRFLARSISDNLLISDSGNNLVQMIDDQGNVVGFSDDIIVSPGQIWPLPDGSVYVGDENSIKRISPSDEISTLIQTTEPVLAGGLGLLIGIAGLPDGSLLAGGRGPIILKVDPDGTFEHYAGSIEGHADGDRTLARFQYNRASFPSNTPNWYRAFANDPDGSVLVADGGWIRRLNPEGQVSTLVNLGSENPPLTRIRGIAISGEGTVFASDEATHSIYRIATDSDRDGVADTDEASKGLTVGVDDSVIDSDMDGFSNSHEARLGTLINDNSDFPGMSLVIDIVPERLDLYVPVFQGQRSVLTVSSDLIDWNELTSFLGTEDGEIIVPMDKSDAKKFYRLVVEFDFVR